MKTRILLVEDDTRLADLTAEYLRKNDFEVTVESRGDTAEARILHDNPALVILDVMLPGKDGFEVCRAVREKYEGVILMLTARDECAGDCRFHGARLPRSLSVASGEPGAGGGRAGVH